MKLFLEFIKLQFQIIRDLINDHRLNNSLPGLSNYNISLTKEPKSYKIFVYFIASIVVSLFVFCAQFVFYLLVSLHYAIIYTGGVIPKEIYGFNCMIALIMTFVHLLSMLVLIIFKPNQKELKEFKELKTEKLKKIKSKKSGSIE